MQALPLRGPPETPRRNRQPRKAGGTSGPREVAKQGGPHLAAVLILLLQQLGNRGHGDAGLEQGLSGCARKEEAGPPPGRLSGAAAAPPPPASLPDGGWRPLDSATIPAAPGAGQRHATCSPRAASPVPAAVHLGAGQRSNAGAYPRSAPRGHRHRKAGTGTRDPSPLPERRASRRSARGGPGNLLLSQGPRWRQTVTYARSREGENARLGGARA